MKDSARERAKEILLDHVGSDDPISSRELSGMLDDDDEVGSFPKTRFLVREIMMEDQIPIAASNNGYYVVETEQELDDYLNQLEQRILGISERKYAVQRAADRWDGDIEPDDDLDIL